MNLFLWLGKTTQLSIIALVAILSGCAERDPVESLRMKFIETEDYNEASAYANALDKMILIGFTGSDWCTYSREMEVKLRSNKLRDNLSDKVVYLNLDFKKNAEARDINNKNQTYANRYGITEMPTFVLVSGTGAELGRITGKTDPDELLLLVNNTYTENKSTITDNDKQILADGVVDMTQTRVATIEEAVQIAGDRKILVEFTGSDWCPPCQRMKSEVLGTRKFKTYAEENLVHVYLDFPRRIKLSPEVVEYNNKTSQEYNVRGFPTYIVMDSNGKELRRTSGYMVGGPDRFINWIERN